MLLFYLHSCSHNSEVCHMSGRNVISVLHNNVTSINTSACVGSFKKIIHPIYARNMEHIKLCLYHFILTTCFGFSGKPQSGN
jgi:hypothetical protein